MPRARSFTTSSERGLVRLRRHYAEELRVAAPVRRNESVIEAFATVPRERFLGPGPWLILPPKRMDCAFMTADAEPHWLYHDVLVAIDRERGINNGEPSLWAWLLDHLDLKPGERVLQIGAGTGYYSAMLAELVGPAGKVIAVEHDAALAAKALDNLRAWPQVETVHGDGTRYDPGEVDAVVAFAGSTHPATVWLKRLAAGGRLLMPLTADNGWGFFLRAVRRGRAFEANSLGPCGFFPCFGGRDARAAPRLRRALARLGGRAVPVRALHRGKPRPGAKRQCWYAGPGFWLSRGPLSTVKPPVE